MPRGVTKDELALEWQSLHKDWYSIYQWEPTSRAGYLDWITEWITESFSEIQLNTAGLRTRSFRVPDHRGQISLSTDIEQTTEKRIVRALFNRQVLPVVGHVLDYEVPLKDTDNAAHGDIDLLCCTAHTCLCLEAKQPGSTESILKAILQAFVYTSLVATKKQAFLNSYALDQGTTLSPGVLTFSTARSGLQLEEATDHPHLLTLVRMLNTTLKKGGMNQLRFFVIENPVDDIAASLSTTSVASGDVKAVLLDRLSLSIVEKTLPHSESM
jgi:hypothetical protein